MVYNVVLNTMNFDNSKFKIHQEIIRKLDSNKEDVPVELIKQTVEQMNNEIIRMGNNSSWVSFEEVSTVK